MRALKPFQPIHLEVSAQHRENPTQKYKVFLSLTLEKPFSSLDESLVAVVVNTASFAPQAPKNITNFSFLLASNNYGLGSFPYLQVGAREPVEALEKVFTFGN
jgi:hypothetical protein